jgi:hypothetical protein
MMEKMVAKWENCRKAASLFAPKQIAMIHLVDCALATPTKANPCICPVGHTGNLPLRFWRRGSAPRQGG